MNSDMFTIKDASKILGLNINTFRYHLKKNSDECDRGIYDTKLLNLMSKIKVSGKCVKNRGTRVYEKYIILDMDEFKTEFEKYQKFIADNKKRRRKNNLGWSNSAVECYERGMRCKDCIHEKLCMKIGNSQPDKIPPMKKTIYKLLTELGVPPKF